VEIALRDYEVFRGEVAMLPPNMARVFERQQPQPEILRVAKLGEQVIGCYAMQEPAAPLRNAAEMPAFTLTMVMVLPSCQRNGVGRWLVGHAIGVAESKGGRRLEALLAGPENFFVGLGFESLANGYCFAMYRE
jgi:predicted N-acetyltransferase YhbS